MKRSLWMKRIALFLCFMLAFTLLAGCGGSDDDDDDDGSGSKKKKKTPTPTQMVTEPPTGDGGLNIGAKLFEAIPDANLNRIDKNLPASVSAKEIKDSGSNVMMTSNSTSIRKFAEMFTLIILGDYIGNAEDKNSLNSVTLKWDDGSETVLLYSGEHFAYQNGDRIEVYELKIADITEAVEELSKGGDEDEGLMDVTCKEEKFTTKAAEGSLTLYQEDNGFYINVDEENTKANSIPYVLIKRWKDLDTTAKNYLTDVATPAFQRSYGDDLKQIGELEELDVELADGTKKKMYGMFFGYVANGYDLCMYRVVGEFGGDLVTFTAKYIDEDDYSYELAMTGLEIAVVYFKLTDRGQTAKNTPTPSLGGKDDFKVVATEQSKIKYEKYDNGLFSAEIPKGWKVEIHDQADYIHYTFQIYNPEKPDVRILYNMQTTGYFATKSDHDWYNNNYPRNELSDLPYLTEQNTLGVLREIYKMIPSTNMFPMRVYSGWEKIESLGYDVFGGEIIHVTAKNPEGKGIEGICSAAVMVFNLYYVNMANAYALTMFTAPEGELSNWIGVFEHIYGSIVYSEYYQSELNKQLIASGQSTMEISRLCSQMTDIVISGWEGRQASYDRISQKQSDATLGYERVYDTEKNEIYRAPLDFFDNYSGSRYQKVTDDQYLLPLDGYIEWK